MTADDSSAPEPSPVAPVDAGDIRPCPLCGGLVRMMALRCRFCGAELPGGAPLSDLVASVSRKLHDADSLERYGEFPHDEAARHGRKFRWGTLLSTALWILCAGGAALAQVHPNLPRVDAEALTILCVVLALFFLIVSCVMLVHDLATPSAAQRIDPESGFKAFLYAMRYGRWKYARACLLPGNVDDGLVRTRVAQSELGIQGGVFSLASLKGFKKLWKPLINSDGLYGRYMTNIHIEAFPIDSRNAIVRCRYRLHAYNALVSVVLMLWCLLAGLIAYYLTRRNAEIEIVKYMREVGGQWYVVSGCIASGEDLLPKLYHDDLERLEQGEPPVDAVLAQVNAAATPMDEEPSGELA